MSSIKQDRVVGRIFTEGFAPQNPIRTVRTTGKERVVMETILQDADVENRNRRIYSKAVMVEALECQVLKEKLERGSLGGEMNHPDPSLGMARQMTLDLTNVSHFIQKIWWEGKDLIGLVETSANRVGRDFAAMILENNMTASFSMRAGGDVEVKNGKTYVKPGLRILTWDAVALPSHRNAYMQKIHENVNQNDYSNEIVVTEGMISKALADTSENAQIMQESIYNTFGHISENFEMSNGVLVHKDVSGKTLGFSKVERSLKDSFNDALSSLIK